MTCTQAPLVGLGLLLAVIVAHVTAVQVTAAGPAAPPKVDYQKNLAMVPEADPAPTAVPPIVESLKNKHPRLLFTPQMIQTLRDQIFKDRDPVLVAAYEGKKTWAQRTNQLPPTVFSDDTSALTAFRAFPAMAYVYAIEKDTKVRDNIIAILKQMLRAPYWADAAELDSNMGAGNLMFIAAVLYDAVYDDLEKEDGLDSGPEGGLRLAMAKKLLTHARRMYYLGYQQKCLMPVKYWQQDPAPNHRWHRGAGMVASLLAIADVPGVDAGFLLQEHKKEMDFLIRWYPEDGDCHEGAGYQRFGFLYLALAASMMDRNLGTRYLEHPGFANAWAQQLHYWAPGRQGMMSFGDEQNGTGTLDPLGFGFFLSPKLSRDANVQAALLNYMKKMVVPPAGRNPDYPWTILACYDPTLKAGDYKAIPSHHLFADLGAASMRDSWEDDAVLLTFKCGPYGGFKLNDYAYAHADDKGNPHYINLAHDDPDANSFALGFGGDFLFHPGNYSTDKRTEQANTLTIDGKGQLGEGDSYTQPVKNVDMRTLAYLTGWKAGEHGRIIVEGEAGKAYPTLDRFRRSIVWMPKQYILILDDVRAPAPRLIMWRGNSEKAKFTDPDAGKGQVYTLKGQHCDFQILADKPFNGGIDFQLLPGRWGRTLLQQTQFSLTSPEVKFACLLDPWKTGATMTFEKTNQGTVITIKGPGFAHQWTWQAADDAQTPSLITGMEGTTSLIQLTATDLAPRGSVAPH